MPGQLGAVVETPAALVAAVGSLRPVDAQMTGKLGAPGEALPALRALVRFLASVGPLVSQEGRALAEAPATLGAEVRPLDWVGARHGIRVMGMLGEFPRRLGHIRPTLTPRAPVPIGFWGADAGHFGLLWTFLLWIRLLHYGCC